MANEEKSTELSVKQDQLSGKYALQISDIKIQEDSQTIEGYSDIIEYDRKTDTLTIKARNIKIITDEMTVDKP